jgi:hypothetical protein
MGSELQSDRAIVVNLRAPGADGASAGHYATDTESPFKLKSDKPAVRDMLHVTQIVRFLLEVSAVFVFVTFNGVCGHWHWH